MTTKTTVNFFLQKERTLNASTNRMYKIQIGTKNLKERLEEEFLIKFREIRNQFPEEVRNAVKIIYSNILSKSSIEKLINGESDNSILPNKLYVAEYDSLRGANGCYVREKRWVILRQDLAEKVKKAEGYNYETAIIKNLEYFDKINYLLPGGWYNVPESNPFDCLLATFCEEIGHHVDEYLGINNNLNYYDTPGDEGELFKILIFEGLKRLRKGLPIFTGGELYHAQKENDVGTAIIVTPESEESNVIVEFQMRERRPRKQFENIRVEYIVFYLQNEQKVDFHTTDGIYRYNDLEINEMKPGEFTARVEVKKKSDNLNVQFFPNQKMDFKFKYTITDDQPNPEDFFANQSSVLMIAANVVAPELNRTMEEEERDAGAEYITIEEALKRCKSGNLTNVKTFPYRGTRFGGAPIFAHRDGRDIIVKQPLYVKYNNDFQKQTQTLPLDVFIGGIRLKPNEVVRVHTYDCPWYYPNITGSTKGDIEDEFCVTGDQMLEIAEKSSLDTLLNVSFTAVDAVTFIIPVGRLAAPLINAGKKGARVAAISIMLGLADAAPTALGGIASRTSIALVEKQMANVAAGRVIANTIEHATIEFTTKASSTITTDAIGGAVVQESSSRIVSNIAGLSVKVTVVDSAGNIAKEILKTPSGDNTVDKIISKMYEPTAGQLVKNKVSQQGIVTLAPEIIAGFKEQEVIAFRKILGKPFSHQDIQIFQQLWDKSTRAGDKAILNRNNSRKLFDLHRNRFWTEVRGNKLAKAIFEDAGCQFKKGAPFYMLRGRRIIITIDHIIQRQRRPKFALNASNLRFSFEKENTVLLRIMEKDAQRWPFVQQYSANK
jgi:hypothetical protein